MSKTLIYGVLLCVTTVAGCGSSKAAPNAPRSDEDAAAETLSKMLEVAVWGDWGAYVDSHYGEQHKFRSPADRDALVKRFQEKWGEKLVQGLRRAAELPVKIDGDRAEFHDGEETVFILYRSESGDWKFHL